MSEYLKDNLGQKSSMRLMSFICLINAIALTWYVTTHNIIESAQFLIGTFLLFAFAPKVAQKFAETKFNPKA